MLQTNSASATASTMMASTASVAVSSQQSSSSMTHLQQKNSLNNASFEQQTSQNLTHRSLEMLLGCQNMLLAAWLQPKVQWLPLESLRVLFYEKKSQFQSGVWHYKNANMPLSSSGIHTTH